MIFSSAYATVLGTLVPLITPETVVVSDELNHNCIINAMRLARPAAKVVYPHLDLEALEAGLVEHEGKAGGRSWSPTGSSPCGATMPPGPDHGDGPRPRPPLPENVVVVVDDSHGVGAFGRSGRGTEEYTDAPPSDVLIGTLGKAFGVNGGYVTGRGSLIRFLRESAPPTSTRTPSRPARPWPRWRRSTSWTPPGGRLLDRLRGLTKHFEAGLARIGIETIPGAHPVVPLMIRDTDRTRALVRHLFDDGILVTGLTYPVVPRGDEEIRTQINADHTEGDIDRLASLEAFMTRSD
jgi:glycine C-acetyltransferase